MHFVKKASVIVQENYLTIFLARFLQAFLCAARKVSFLVQDLQDMCKICIFIVGRFLLGYLITTPNISESVAQNVLQEIHHILFPPPQIKSERSGLGTRLYQAV